MRVAGWIFLAAGTAGILLVAILAIGQGEFYPHLLYFAISAVVLGGSLRAYPQTASQGALVKSTIFAEAGSTSSSAPEPDTGPTIELAMTPSAASAIRTAPWKSLATVGIVLSCALAIALTISFIYDRTHTSAGSPRSTGNAFAIVIAVSFVGLLCLVSWAVGVWRPARRDLRESTYLRTSGPIEVVELNNGYILRLADRKLQASADIGSVLVKLGLDWAVVDHSRHARIILGVWDLAGQNVFAAPGYHAEPPRITLRK